MTEEEQTEQTQEADAADAQSGGVDWKRNAAALAVFFAALFAVLGTLHGPGMTWDEAIDIKCARDAAAWFALLVREPGRALRRESIRRNWEYEWKQHPAVSRIVSACGAAAFHGARRDALFRNWYLWRIGTALVFALAASLVLLLGWEAVDPLAGAAAAIAFAGMPRVFGHAHLVATDMMLCAAWLAAAVFFMRGLRSRGAALLFGVFLGLAPAVKFTGLFAAVPLFAWGAVFARGRLRNNFLAALIVAPVVFVAVQPMYWLGPVDAFRECVTHFAAPGARGSIVVHFLGKNYAQSPPWTYPFVMIVATVPGLVLVAAAAGVARAVVDKKQRAALLFLAVNAVFVPLLFAPRRVAVYDGERLLLAALPFVALLAGAGVSWLFARARWPLKAAALLVLSAYCVSGVAGARPYYLSYYNGAVGGLQGAHARGLEATYWGDAFTPDFAREMNRLLPRGARLCSIGYFPGNLTYFQDMGLLRRDIVITPYGQEADFVLAMNRRGVWDPYTESLWSNAPPLMERSHQGVRLAAVFLLRPGLRFYHHAP